MAGLAPQHELPSFHRMEFRAFTFPFVFSVCVLNECSVQCHSNVYRIPMYTGFQYIQDSIVYRHTVPVDVQLSVGLALSFGFAILLMEDTCV